MDTRDVLAEISVLREIVDELSRIGVRVMSARVLEEPVSIDVLLRAWLENAAIPAWIFLYACSQTDTWFGR